MKLLAAFGLVCALMLGLVVRYLVTGGARGPRCPADNRVQPPALHAAPVLLPQAQSASPTPPTELLQSGQEPQSTVAPGAATRWAQDPAVRKVLERLEEARAALAEDPYQPAALRDELTALLEMGRWSEALRPLGVLLELYPDDSALRFEQAALLMRLRRFSEALVVLKQVVEERPDWSRGWFNLAAAHQALGHLAEARWAWDRTIELSPSSEALARRAEVLLDLHEWSAAAADCRRVLESEPDTPDVLLNLSLALSKLGRSDQARSGLLEYLERHPCHVPVLNRLAELSWADCQTPADDARRLCDEAIAWWRRSLECDPTQTDVKEHLAAVGAWSPSGQRPAGSVQETDKRGMPLPER